MSYKKWLLAAALATASPTGLLASTATAAPAPASDNLAARSSTLTKDGCTVTAQKPYFVSIAANGLKRVRFRVPFSCAGNRSIVFEHEAYDSDVGEDSASDRLLRKIYGPYVVPASGGSGAYYWDLLVKQWDGNGDPYVELYHRVRFRVSGGTGWSSWVESSVVKFHV